MSAQGWQCTRLDADVRDTMQGALAHTLLTGKQYCAHNREGVQASDAPMMQRGLSGTREWQLAKARHDGPRQESCSAHAATCPQRLKG